MRKKAPPSAYFFGEEQEGERVARGERRVVWEIAATFIGAVVGAGFASGQELSQFFLGYGAAGQKGIMLAGLLFACWAAGILELSARRALASYPEYLAFLLGRAGALCFDGVVTLFLFSAGSIMLAAGNALFTEHLGAPAGAGGLLTGLAVLAVLWGGLESLIAFNLFLVPLKFLICAALYLFTLKAGFCPAEQGRIAPLVPHWMGAGFLYVGFNMLGATVVLVPLGRRGKGRLRLAGAALGGFGLALFALILFRILLTFRELALREVPLLFVAAMVHPGLKYAYFLVLWASLLSTAVVNFYGVATRLARLVPCRPYRASLLVVLAAGLLFARCRFSFLVRTVYPLFGGLGLVLLAPLIFRLLSRSR